MLVKFISDALKTILVTTLLLLTSCYNTAETSTSSESKEKVLEQLRAPVNAAMKELENASNWEDIQDKMKKLNEIAKPYQEALAKEEEKVDTTGKKNKFLSTPDSEKELEEFNNQTDQLELNGCEITLNGNSAPIADPAAVLKLLGGNYMLQPSQNASSKVFFWPHLQLTLVQPKDINDWSLLIEFTSQFNTDPTKVFSNILLLQKAPLRGNKSVANFLSSSHFDIDDFSAGNGAYYLHYDCQNDSNQKIEYQLGSTGIWNYKGSGHLMLKDGLDKENPNPFFHIYIYRATK